MSVALVADIGAISGKRSRQKVIAGTIIHRMRPLPRGLSLLALCGAALVGSSLAQDRASDQPPAAAPQDQRPGPANKSEISHPLRDEHGFRALYTMNRDGSDVRFLFAAPGMHTTATPEWSHDGTTIVCDAVPRIDALTECRVFVASFSGPNKGMVRDLGFGNTPSWSPDDRQIAFMLNDGNPDMAQGGVWIMNADGTGRKRVCDGWYPRWSPDGERLVVDAHGNLLIKTLKTGGERLLLPPGIRSEFGGGNWSPDGARIVFIALREGGRQIATMNVNGGVETLTILCTAENSHLLVGPPAWSPDGKKIVFAIQDLAAGEGDGRLWWQTHLYSVWTARPNPPTMVEGTKIGAINRGMNWSRDGNRIVFSSDR